MLNWLSNARKNTKAFFARDLSLTDSKGWPSSFYSMSTAGTVVDANSSQQLSAYYACLRNISEDLAKLPKAIYSPIEGGGRDKINGNVSRIINEQPNPNMTAFNFWQFMFYNAPGWGDSIAEIQRNKRGELVALHPIHPSRVIKATFDEQGLVWIIRGEDGINIILKDSEVFHLSNTTSNGITGIPIPTIAQESLGVALATQDFTGNFFANGALLTGVLTHPGKLSDEAGKRMRDSWATQFSGADNSGKTALLEDGTTFAPMSMPLKDAELIDQMKFQVVEICRWFRMQPHKIAHLDNATFTNIESQSREYVDDTLMSWAVRAEQEIKRKLLPGSKQFAKFNFNSLLRGDTAARQSFYTAMFNIGVLNPDEIREKEDMNPIPDGKGQMYYVQGNLMELGSVGMTESEGDGDPQVSEEMLNFESLKSEADAYGVGVRAGMITPQTEDEKRFRAKSGLPDMSSEVIGAWEEESGFRRPITLAVKTEDPIFSEELDDQPVEQEPVEQSENQPDAMLSSLKPIINDYFRDLVNREVKTFTNTHKRFLSNKIDEAGFIEATDKFYSDYRAKANEKLIIYSNAIKEITKKDFSYKSMLVDVSDTSAQLLKNSINDEMALNGLLEEWSISKADALTDSFFGIATAKPKLQETPKVGDHGEFDGKLYKFSDGLEWELVNVSDNGN